MCSPMASKLAACLGHPHCSDVPQDQGLQSWWSTASRRMEIERYHKVISAIPNGYMYVLVSSDFIRFLYCEGGGGINCTNWLEICINEWSEVSRSVIPFWKREHSSWSLGIPSQVPVPYIQLFFQQESHWPVCVCCHFSLANGGVHSNSILFLCIGKFHFPMWPSKFSLLKAHHCLCLGWIASLWFLGHLSCSQFWS